MDSRSFHKKTASNFALAIILRNDGTVEDVVNAGCEFSESSVFRSITELLEKKYIEPTGAMKLCESGRNRKVYRINPRWRAHVVKYVNAGPYTLRKIDAESTIEHCWRSVVKCKPVEADAEADAEA